MKKYIYLVIGILVLASCSSPKYTYNFDYYDYNSGKKKSNDKGLTTQQPTEESVLVIDEKTLVASSNESEVYIAKPAPTITKAEAEAKIKSMSKEERKELKKEVKKYVKASKKSDSVKSGDATKALSGDLKLAAILGAVGIVLLIIGGDALSIIGAIFLLAGLFFLVRYLINH